MRADYATEVEQPADGLVAEGLMLEEDAEAIKEAAAASQVL